MSDTLGTTPLLSIDVHSELAKLARARAPTPDHVPAECVRRALWAGAHHIRIQLRAGRVEIEDDGSGIGPADLAAIFDPFFTTKSLGTGLGLTNARKVVELHDGEIRIESEPGVGTRVTVAIPYEELRTGEARSEEPQAEVHEVHTGH